MQIKGSILLVDDDHVFNERLGKAFTVRDFEVHLANNYSQAMEQIKKHMPHYCVVDLKMPGKSGLEVIKDGLALNREMNIIVLTGYGSIATATDAIKLGAYAYLAKPVDIDDIIRSLSKKPEPTANLSEDNITAPSLARAEWEHINRVLADCKGNISETAKRLGIHRRSLQRKLYKYPPKK